MEKQSKKNIFSLIGMAALGTLLFFVSRKPTTPEAPVVDDKGDEPSIQVSDEEVEKISNETSAEPIEETAVVVEETDEPEAVEQDRQMVLSEPTIVEPKTETAVAEVEASMYVDGLYSATGSYTAPSGTETVGVSLTVTDDVVTDVAIDEQAVNPTSQKMQALFADGISTLVIGKRLEDISVSQVSGSSLTSKGFNQALEAIKAQAKG